MNQSTDPIDLNTLERMMQFIPSDTGRDEWVNMLMAAKSEFGDDAKHIMQAWSANAASYDAKAFNATWKSIKSGGGVTIGSLIHEAKENGFKFALVSAQDKKRLAAEQRQRQAKRKQQEAEQQAQRLNGYEEAKQRAYKLLNEKAVITNNNHPYFIKKGIQVEWFHLRWVYQLYGTLLIPVYGFKCPPKPVDLPYAHGNLYQGSVQGDFPVVDVCDHSPLFELVSLQFIDEKGGKFFLKGGQTKGGFFPVRFNGGFETLVICEGYATAVTYAHHYETEADIICAFNAGNLKTVAKAFKLRFPRARMVIAADNDRFNKDGTPTKMNTGIVKAKEAAKAVDAALVIPEFKDGQMGNDFNDLYLLSNQQEGEYGHA